MASIEDDPVPLTLGLVEKVWAWGEAVVVGLTVAEEEFPSPPTLTSPPGQKVVVRVPPPPCCCEFDTF